ncbi:hypothetical protein SAMN04488118_11752 [Epibacterium ulvae]|uniref:Uncharacterized protein n=1 Tax=Epibacterium ulvae TaxID=1156985 RepID=A0A1G5RHC8_9RHOB|nr:hypothetical protein [Epibacterium ulvae]SCZ73532.1 hypothetical protein SAMN04488118_11752 [Epibacterium ulvae]
MNFFKCLKTLAVSTALSLPISTFTPIKTEAYQIDCAILICLAGGWPSSEECSAARAEFIRRITPYPVEPPLQIWRCPMGASFEPTEQDTGRMRLLRVMMGRETPHTPDQSKVATTTVPSTPDTLLDAQPAVFHRSGGTAAPLPDSFLQKIMQDEGRGADIDISGAEFDYVRSIKVYQIDYRTRLNGDGDCDTSDRSRIGLYGVQGDYSWRRFGARSVPSYIARVHSCPRTGRVRGVGVEWRDYKGNLGYEWVRY